MDCSLPGSSVPGVLQARILEWLPCPPPDSRIEPGSPVLQADSLSSEPPLQTKCTHIETKHRCHPVYMSAFQKKKNRCSSKKTINQGNLRETSSRVPVWPGPQGLVTLYSIAIAQNLLPQYQLYNISNTHVTSLHLYPHHHLSRDKKLVFLLPFWVSYSLFSTLQSKWTCKTAAQQPLQRPLICLQDPIPNPAHLLTALASVCCQPSLSKSSHTAALMHLAAPCLRALTKLCFIFWTTPPTTWQNHLVVYMCF